MKDGKSMMNTIFTMCSKLCFAQNGRNDMQMICKVSKFVITFKDSISTFQKTSKNMLEKIESVGFL